MGNFRMTDKPIYPIILTDNSTGYLDLVDNEDRLTTSNALGLIKGSYKKFQAYDKDGQMWKVDKVGSNYKINGLTKFLAYTIYNPQIKVSIIWTKIGNYQLSDLKEDIVKQLNRDDDIITQFNSAKLLREKIENCISFDSIVKTLYKYVFNVS
jgi:hypothetical protein